MAANIVIRADVVDISKDTPRNNENFLVDTNVWYWMTYSKEVFIVWLLHTKFQATQGIRSLL